MGNTILFDVPDNIATITINRPQQANALDISVAQELAKAAFTCDADSGIRAVILTGKGDSFCVGGDLNAFRSAESQRPQYIQELVNNLHAAMSHFMRMDAPLVVAVNGRTGGAGVSIALAGDLIFAARSSSFVLGYTAVGLVPDGGSTYTLPRRIGWPLAKELMLTNRRVEAAEAKKMGLVSEVFDDSDLLDRAKIAAKNFAKGPTEVFGATKRLLLNSGSESLETQMELEARQIVKSAGHPNAAEGISAFLDKRPARFFVED